jgi:uncharacterized membrane protein YjfL (UPF0719 family)
MDALLGSLAAMLALVPYLLFALVLFFLGKLVFDLTTPGIQDDKELSERRNPAFAVFWAGYMLGLALAISGALLRLGPSIWENLVDIGTSGVAAILLLRLSMVLGDRLILRDFDANKEIVGDRNLGAGFAFAGLFVASGLVIAGVMTGRSDSWLGMVRDIAVYWATGQIFIVGSWFVFRLLARYDVHKSIAEDNNAAVGISLGGFFAAMGVILKAALTNAGSDLGAELLVTLVVGLVGLLFLALARALTTLVLLPRVGLGSEVAVERNVAAGAVSAVSYVASALLLGALVTSQLQ